MNGQFLDLLAQRRIDLHFISPAICENDFSSTGDVMIILDPFIPWQWGSGPVWFFDGGNRYLWWGVIPGIICVSVYQNIDGEYVLIAECIDPNVPWGPLPPTVIPEDVVVTVIDDDGGESNPSVPPVFTGTCVNISSVSPALNVPLEYGGCDPVTFSVTATGSVPMTFRWYLGTTLMHTGGSSSYAFPMAKNLAGLWSVSVSNTLAGCAPDTEGSWDLVYKPLEIVTVFDEEGGCVGEPYLFTYGAEGGTPITCDHYDWTITDGALPDGLSLDLVTGEVSGTPTTGGLSTFTVTATDDEGDSVSETDSIVVIEFTKASPLLDGIENDVYSDSVTADPPGLTFSHVAGTIPPGLSVEAGGNITGTPTTGGDYTFTVRAESADPLWSCEKDYTIKIWFEDNTFITRFGYASNRVAQTAVSINAGVPLDPGVYVLTMNWVDFGSPMSLGFTGNSIKYPVYPHGAYALRSVGGPLGDLPNNQPPAWLHTPGGTILSVITGATFTCDNVFPGVPTCNSGTMQALLVATLTGSVARWTLYASTVVKFTFPAKPAAIHTDPETYDGGGLGAGWNVYRIGKATP